MSIEAHYAAVRAGERRREAEEIAARMPFDGAVLRRRLDAVAEITTDDRADLAALMPTSPDYAALIVDHLALLLARYRHGAACLTLARDGHERPERGRPTDTPLRNLEAAVLTVLESHGLPCGRAARASAGPIVEAVLYVASRHTTDAAGDPANSLRRADARRRMIDYFDRVEKPEPAR